MLVAFATRDKHCLSNDIQGRVKEWTQKLNWSLRSRQIGLHHIWICQQTQTLAHLESHLLTVPVLDQI